MCSIRAHLKLLKLSAQVYSSNVLFRLSIGASMCLVRVHVKVLKFTGQGYSSSLLVTFTPQFETVIESRLKYWLIYVCSESPFKTVGRIGSSS